MDQDASYRGGHRFRLPLFSVYPVYRFRRLHVSDIAKRKYGHGQ